MSKVKKGFLKVFIFLLFLLIISLPGCNIKVVNTEEKREDVSFAIVSKECLPDSLAKLMEERKENTVKLTYMDQGKRYVVVGYGKQKTSGYSIYIKEFYKTGNALYVDTCLMGPQDKEKIKKVESYPMIVLQISEMGMPVVFK